jgi:asparagine synthase (glutamine-hydrolysing)
MSHERLAIVDPSSGKQPLLSEDKQLILAANGEIYKNCVSNLKENITESDCEVILALYKKRTSFRQMNGIFGFAIYDVEKESILLPVITWGLLFHYTLVGINMELLCGFRIDIEGYCTKIQLFPQGII